MVETRTTTKLCNVYVKMGLCWYHVFHVKRCANGRCLWSRKRIADEGIDVKNVSYYIYKKIMFFNVFYFWERFLFSIGNIFFILLNLLISY